MLATGMVAMDISWGDVIQTLGPQSPIRPTIHPYATAMNLGVWLLALKEHDEGGKEFLKLKKKLLTTGENAHEIWPIWFNQTGYFNTPGGVGVLAGDLDLVEAMDGLIETFERPRTTITAINTLKRCWLRQCGTPFSVETSVGPYD